ncbi:glycosyl hydrolase family 8 [Croceicoccus mobilis]|uniref:Glucanase n=1 Tax=Croceicoccus mobilis TaxID=1703339 RepID=A0A917DPC3_9SPHN|nr:glycosyl hydrolase family 8 [Croceicoccus mobilis]GGD56285.1 endoglucanase [Croceicoccus mobilis]
MRLERRHFLAALAAMSSSNCSYASPSPKARSEYLAKAGETTSYLIAWTDFKSRYIQKDGRVVDNGNGGISHSEGQGYALVLAELAGDREIFDRVWNWTDKNLAQQNKALFIWRFDPNASDPLADPNNATDGDILIAWALGRAAARWQNSAFESHAAATRAAIAGDLVLARERLLLLPAAHGFVHEDRIVLNLSYYIWPALSEFAEREPKGPWTKIMEDGLWLLGQSRFGGHQLPSDWISYLDGKVTGPAPGWEPRFGFDAVRIPLYLGLSGLQGRAQHIIDFWRSYFVKGNIPPAWVDVKSGAMAEYALSYGASTYASLLAGVGTDVTAEVQHNYYSAVLNCFSRLLSRMA